MFVLGYLVFCSVWNRYGFTESINDSLPWRLESHSGWIVGTMFFYIWFRRLIWQKCLRNSSGGDTTLEADTRITELRGEPSVSTIREEAERLGIAETSQKFEVLPTRLNHLLNVYGIQLSGYTSR